MGLREKRKQTARTFRLAIVAVAAMLAVLVPPVGVGAGQADSNTVSVGKFVIGEAPPGAVFEVELACTPISADADALTTMDPITFRFDATGTALVPNQFIDIGDGYQCTATETVTNGASVRYACEVRVFPDDSVPPPGNDPDIPAQCLDDQTIIFRDFPTESGVADLVVINTFPDAEPETEAAPEIVAAQPAFTG